MTPHSTDSGKRGGATSAAANGATDKQLKRLGGWRSDSMPDKYVDLSVPSRILLSKMLQKSSQSSTLSLNNKLSLYRQIICAKNYLLTKLSFICSMNHKKFNWFPLSVNLNQLQEN
jgi:hypothetical protein